MNGKSKDHVAVFEKIEVVDHLQKKFLQAPLATITVNKKSFYIGQKSNWKISWGDIEEIKCIDDHSHNNRYMEIVDRSHNLRHFKCYDADPELWVPFHTFVENHWKKRQRREHSNNNNGQSMTANSYYPNGNKNQSKKVVQKRKARAVYGRRSRSRLEPRLELFDPHLSDEDDENQVPPIVSNSESFDANNDNNNRDDTNKSRNVEDDPIDNMSPRASHVPVVKETDEYSFDESTDETSPNRPPKQKQRRLRRSKGHSSNDSDDDNIFPADDLTTPAAQRIVSPTIMGTKEQDQQQQDATANTAPITNFFSRTTNKTAKITQPMTKTKTVGTTTNSSHTIQRKTIETMKTKPPRNKTKLIGTYRSVSKKTNTISPHSLLSNNRDAVASYQSPKRLSLTPPKEEIVRSSDISSFVPTQPLLMDKDHTEEDIEKTPSPQRQLEKSFHIAPLKNPYCLMKNDKGTLRSSGEDLEHPAKARHTRALPFKGFRNLGNNCYINASLQMLFTVGDFISSLSNNGSDLVRSVVGAAQHVSDIRNSRSASAKAIKLAMDKKTDKFKGYEQRDAHEFLSDLIDGLHEELEVQHRSVTADDTECSKKTEFLPTDDFFRFTVQVCLKCDSCGYSRCKEEMYRYLSLDIDYNDDLEKTVEKSLEQFFQPDERQVTCEKCKDGKSASQTMRLLSRPKALLLHLKRFVLVNSLATEEDKENSSITENSQTRIIFQKNKGPVIIPENLFLEKFMNAERTQENCETVVYMKQQYSLSSIVHHIGSSTSSGHYTADAIRTCQPSSGEESSKWISFDDDSLSETSLFNILSDQRCRRTAYMLLYTKK